MATTTVVSVPTIVAIAVTLAIVTRAFLPIADDRRHPLIVIDRVSGFRREIGWHRQWPFAGSELSKLNFERYLSWLEGLAQRTTLREIMAEIDAALAELISYA